MVRKGSRGNTREPNVRGTVDHVTVIPVISASGQVMTLLVLFHGRIAKYRVRVKVKFETPSVYLPSTRYFYMRPVSGVDNNLFISCANIFLEETAHI